MIKLIAYNLKFGKNKHLLMALIIFLAAIVLRISIFGLTNGSNELEFDTNEPNLATMVTFPLFVLLIFAASISSLWAILGGLYRNIFGKQGYLMQTLPVTKHRLVQSQYITAVLWFNFMVGVTGVSIIILASAIGKRYLSEIWSEFDVVIMVVGLLMSNLYVLFLVATVFMGMTLANSSFSFKKIHPFIATVVTFIYFNVIQNVIRFLSNTRWLPQLFFGKTATGFQFTMISSIGEPDDFQRLINITSTLFLILFTIGNYFITVWLLEKHTDL